jgi:Kdo2-lipid IVA lauroyltransferase/acyltransferase
VALIAHLQGFAEGAGFRLVRHLCLMLGLDRASAFSGWMWRKLAPWNQRHARARRHMTRALPHLSAAQIDAHLLAMWDNLGRTMAESFFLESIVRDPARFELAPAVPAIIERVRAQGGVFVGGHMGNWELGAPLLWSNGIEVGGIYRHVNSPVIDQAVLGLRERFYRAGLWRKTGQAARNALRAADQKKVLALLGDLRDPTGASVPFFGQPAPSTLFPAHVARDRKVPIFVALFRRTGGAHFLFDAVEITPDWTDDRSADLARVTAAVQAQLETWIREAPAQWMWAHRRWISKEEEKRGTSELLAVGSQTAGGS